MISALSSLLSRNIGVPAWGVVIVTVKAAPVTLGLRRRMA
jgi:hypothetical protein